MHLSSLASLVFRFILWPSFSFLLYWSVYKQFSEIATKHPTRATLQAGKRRKANKSVTINIDSSYDPFGEALQKDWERPVRRSKALSTRATKLMSHVQFGHLTKTITG